MHIPFCRARCDYCDFFTRTSVAPERLRAVLRRTRDHVKTLLTEHRSMRVRTLYVGGGTPSFVGPECIAEFVRGVCGLLDGPDLREVTVEVNPEDVTQTLLNQLAGAGVDRISVGIQSFDASALASIGRIGSADAGRRALQLISTCWDHRWTADIIAAIPGERPNRLKEDAETLLEYGPRHVSIYELTIEERTRLGLRFRRGLVKTPDNDRIAAQFVEVTRLLHDAGLQRYEVSNFALPGDESVHNGLYWDYAPYFGAGPGAVGSIPSGDPARPIVRMTAPRSFDHYLSRLDYGVETEALTRRECAAEVLMMGLRTRRGVRFERFSNIAGVDLLDAIAASRERYARFFRTTESGVALSEAGINVLDSILRDVFFDLDVTVPPA